MEQFYTIAMFVSIITFTLSTVLTPGPNNIMLLSSGLTFGYKRTLPHIFGVMLGFPIMVICIGLGMDFILKEYPVLLVLLKVISFVYLLWMAYKIATNIAIYDEKNTNKSTPFTFLQAALFQWLNPKAWIMAITAISIFVSNESDVFVQVCIIALIYLFSSIVSTNFWAYGGVILHRFLQKPLQISIFNKIMAFILVVSVLPFLFE